MRSVGAGLAILVAMSGGLVACGDSGGDDAASVDVAMKEFEFIPDSWVVPADAEITANLTNEGTIVHEWVILRPGVTITSESDLPETEEELLADFVYWEDEVEAGGSKTVTFTAPPPGTYQIICAIDGHFSAGMEGELVVVISE